MSNVYAERNRDAKVTALTATILATRHHQPIAAIVADLRDLRARAEAEHNDPRQPWTKRERGLWLILAEHSDINPPSIATINATIAALDRVARREEGAPLHREGDA